ncbi:MAG: insulinase family protein [Bacteroidales bacterium]|nr:insulinase family protein [Bacteroidales bacterium]
MEYLTHTLSNGIRLVHKPVDSIIAHTGLFINAGSRDENEEEHGMAHLIEHMLFKGTEKRRAFHILSRMENVGGEINAYTTKEETVIYSTFFSEYYSRALELIGDIAFHSSFPLQELKKEKEIILDEINSYKDSPSELIFDEFEELLFDGNPLSRNILGDEKKLKTFQSFQMHEFIERNYATDQMVVSSVGRIGFSRLIRLFEMYFSSIDLKGSGGRLPVQYHYKPVMKTVDRQTYQAHCIVGNIAYDIRDDKRIVLALLNNLLGGPGLNSRLNMALRERKGFAYTIDSLYTPYGDTGNLTIYFGTDKSLVEKCILIVLKELRTLCTKSLSHAQLVIAKKQIMGQAAISAEINESNMLTMGKSFLLFNKVEDLKETGRKLDAITEKQLLAVANEVLDPEKLSYLIYR